MYREPGHFPNQHSSQTLDAPQKAIWPPVFSGFGSETPASSLLLTRDWLHLRRWGRGWRPELFVVGGGLLNPLLICLEAKSISLVFHR